MDKNKNDTRSLVMGVEHYSRREVMGAQSKKMPVEMERNRSTQKEFDY